MASSIYGLIQTHPNDPSRPLVDFDVALTFIPALLLGVSFGENLLPKRPSLLAQLTLFAASMPWLIPLFVWHQVIRIPMYRTPGGTHFQSKVWMFGSIWVTLDIV